MLNEDKIDPTPPPTSGLVCKGARLVTGPQGIYGPMSLVCITCGQTITEFLGESNVSATKWIKESSKTVKDHQDQSKEKAKI